MRSYLPDFQLSVPPNLPSALALLASGEGWRPLAGGTDLMVLFNAGKLPFHRLLSLRNLDELQQITVTDTEVIIGAAATYTQIQRHSTLQREFPLLCQAASWTGGVANQNQGTIGGNIANASPAADSLPALLVHEASLQLESLACSRSVPYSEFHLDYKLLALQPDELITSIRLPRRSANWRSYGRKVGTRRAQAIAKVALAAAARVEHNRLADVRLAFASIAPVPLRCFAIERLLLQRPLTRDTILEARRSLQSEIRPIDDLRSTAAYRSQVAQNLLAEFLESLS
jgi:CO/xanthine dehydrogenase FAD-binding subunit